MSDDAPTTSLPFITEAIGRINEMQVYGQVTTVKGLLVECAGIEKVVSIGARCRIFTRTQGEIIAEAVGFSGNQTLLMPFTVTEGIGPGCKVILEDEQSVVYPHDAWRGRIVDALGNPIDGKGALPQGGKAYRFRNTPPPAHQRGRVGEKLDLGIKAINSFITCCKGQRLGIFSGSGVGKSMLLSMMAKFSRTDIKVIGLIGERGREVREFIEEYLGEEGLANAVVIVATSDESALMRRQAAYLTLSVAEFFRDQEKDVLCLMDSVTRFAMAQREIGLSAGEPPTTKGYTPTVFSELPKLLERAGPGEQGGSITGLFSVLVEGDDTNEPISDAVRGILDGHIVMNRHIAERGRFPAIDVLKSVSRMLPHCNSDEENALINKARQYLSTYNDMADMIRLGAYRKGSDPMVDEAIKYFGPIDAFLAQKPQETSTFEEGYATLSAILQGTQQES